MDDEPAPPLPAPDPSPQPAEGRGLPKRLRGTHVAQDEIPPHAVARGDPGRAARALERARFAARIADENRARDIVLLDLRAATPLVDFFVIATAASRRQANAIAIEIDAEMKKIGEFKLGFEGSEEGRWILIDYGDFVVHVFNPEARAYYALEDLWGDAVRLDWEDPDRPRRGVRADGGGPAGPASEDER
jgi:ribosome-associated protein